MSNGPLASEYISAIWRVRSWLQVVRSRKTITVCTRPVGTYSEQAMHEYFGQSKVCRVRLSDAFRSVEAGADLASCRSVILTEGAVSRTLDLAGKHNY